MHKHSGGEKKLLSLNINIKVTATKKEKIKRKQAGVFLDSACGCCKNVTEAVHKIQNVIRELSAYSTSKK